MNLSEIKEKEREEICSRVDFALSLFESQDTDIVDILKTIYVEYMPVGSEEHGIIMAKHIVDIINSLDKAYEAASSDNSNNCEQSLKALLENLSTDKKVQTLMSVNYILKSIKEASDGQMPDAAPLEAQLCNTDDISEEKLDELFRQTVSNITDENTMNILLKKFASSSIEERKCRINVRRNQDISTVMAIQAMIIYTMVKTGKLSGIPKDVTMFEIVAGVCTERFLNSQSDLQNENSNDDLFNKIAFWLIALIVVASMTALTIACLAGSALSFFNVFLGVLCIAFSSGALISVEYIFFNDCLLCDVFDFPKIKFSEFMSNTMYKAPEHTGIEAHQTSVSQQKEYAPLYDKPIFSTDEDKLYNRLFDPDVLYY